MAWMCLNNPEHKFDDLPEGEDMNCPLCKEGGILVDAGTMDTDYANELGLCVFLMDTSFSMTQSAIPPSKKNRLTLITETAAEGIFDLQGITKAKETYICVMGFSQDVHTIFFDSAYNLFRKYNGNVDAFASYLYDELSQLPGDTNINGALDAAYTLVNKFLKKELPTLDDYEVLHHALWTHDDQDIDVPNVRVLLYTDGEHNVPNATDPIINPFLSMNPDVLMGVFIGRERDRGYDKLRGVLSKCPEHNYPQFFLLDNAEKLTTLRKFFHMASGTSGFCVKCEKQ